MWSSLVQVAAACGAVALAKTLEPPNWEVSEALRQLGVNVSTLPQLNALHQEPCRAACGSLKSIYGSEKVFSPNTTAYGNATGSFWSVQQEEVNPYCFFTPAINTEVAVAVLLSRLTGCPFAAKSGGHAAFAGASSSPGGITIWFKDLNAVTLNANKTIASVGPGNTWGEVYTALEPHGLAVVGGRASSIGVGGFVTGGGISYHSNLYGWANDNVHSFEVVTATGDIITASATTHQDLYWALRGGGNNFGLVTSFNLYTIPSPQLYAGTRVYAEELFPSVIDAFISVVNDAPLDGNAQQYVAFITIQGQNFASAELTYVTPKNTTNATLNAPIYASYNALPALSDTTRPRTLVNQTYELDKSTPTGFREVYWPIATLLDVDFSNWTVELFYESIQPILSVPDINPVIVYQGITIPILEKMTRDGGNPLGLNGSNGPIHLMHIACWWRDAADDERIYAVIHEFWENVIAKAKELDLFHEYVYMNYASQFQDVISGYGEKNKERLKRVARKYDPGRVFQTLQPGYFKLEGAPVDYVGVYKHKQSK